MAEMVRISGLNLDGRYQFMPDPDENEYDSLKADIRTFGIQCPVEIDENNRPLDGWTRIRACRELGIDTIPAVIRDTGMSEEMKIEHAIALNMDRRQITNSQKEDVICKIIDMYPDYSFARLAKITGLSDKTVKKIAERKRPTPECSEVGRHEGADGRIRPDSGKSAEIQRENIRQAIREDPDKSDRQIARETGASPTTVGSQRTEMARAEIPHTDNSEYKPEPVMQMSEAESLKMNLLDEAEGLDMVLDDIFSGYRPEYADAAREGLDAFYKVLKKHEKRINRSEREPE